MQFPSDVQMSENRQGEIAGTQSIKNALRRERLALRDVLDDTEIATATAKIYEALNSFKPFSEAECISLYVSVRSEVPTRDEILRLLEQGKRVAVPKVCGNEIRLFQIKDVTGDLKPGAFGIPEPGEHCTEISIEVPTCHIIPGAVFDMSGNRIGYGKGFYDRYLKKISKGATTVGLAFDCQVIEKFQTEPTDEPVGYLVSPHLGIRKAQTI